MALSALATGEIASRFGMRPEPFYLGIVFVAFGLALSVLFVRDTTEHARHESRLRETADAARSSSPRVPPHIPRFRELLRRTSWSDPALASISQAGLVNNLNDGLAWGLFPLFFAAAGLSVRQIGVLA